MIRALNRIFLAMVCVLVVPTLAMAASCINTGCHAAYDSGKYLHAPAAAGECLSCHETTGEPHPGERSMRLSTAEPGLCLQCHENPSAGMAFPHSAVGEGCTGCHDPHQSESPRLVYEQGGELCLTCHEVVLEGEYAHGPVRANNCKMCHGVHGGEYESMLNLPGKDICFACHSGIKNIIDNSKSQHDPVANGVCWDCHKPHAADFEPFLEGPYLKGFYEPYDEKKYRLCFKCHSETAMEYWLTSEATGFRNHNSNLHSFHVNRFEKGRVCKACHGVHGGQQEKLLYSHVPDFGSWSIPMAWVPIYNGAVCFVGCHTPKRYDREVKQRN